MRRALRSILVGMLVMAMGVDPATACHFLRSRWGNGGWGAGDCSAPVEYAGPCNGVIIDGDGCCSFQGYVHEIAVVEDDCCCQGEAVVEHEGVIEDEVHPAPEPAPAETFKPAEVEQAPTLPPDLMPAQPVEPADDELLTPPAPTATPSEPVTPAPAPAAATPAPPTPPPATENDLFGPTTEPATTNTPAETSAAPSTEPMDDFFSESPTPPADAAPAVESAPAPATPPAPATTPAPAVTTPAPTETPVAPPADATEATPGATDLFGETPAATTEPAPSAAPAAEAPADENVEDLGMDALDASEQPATPADDGAPAVPETPPATEEPATETDDLFDFGAILREPGGLSSSEMRRWVDNTGRYSCNGRLLRFVDGQVQLLKENGRTSTLPLYRLSDNDLQFVHRQASAQQAQIIGQTVQSMTVVSSLAF